MKCRCRRLRFEKATLSSNTAASCSVQSASTGPGIGLTIFRFIAYFLSEFLTPSGVEMSLLMYMRREWLLMQISV